MSNKCQTVNVPNMISGWKCCQPKCNSFNGDQRINCKFCGHACCRDEPKFKTIPYQTDKGTIVLQPIKVPDPNKPSN